LNAVSRTTAQRGWLAGVGRLVALSDLTVAVTIFLRRFQAEEAGHGNRQLVFGFHRLEFVLNTLDGVSDECDMRHNVLPDSTVAVDEFLFDERADFLDGLPDLVRVFRDRNIDLPYKTPFLIQRKLFP